jgi:hypothetical protein
MCDLIQQTPMCQHCRLLLPYQDYLHRLGIQIRKNYRHRHHRLPINESLLHRRHRHRHQPRHYCQSFQGYLMGLGLHLG